MIEVAGGLSDRCADFMQAAFPGAEIRFTKRDAAGTGCRERTGRGAASAALDSKARAPVGSYSRSRARPSE